MTSNIAKQIISCFEHGTPVPQYGSVSVLRDDNGRLQISYGIIQTNEKSNLGRLLDCYCSRHGAYYRDFARYITSIGYNKLHADEEFKDLLRLAGQDHIMMECQEELYNEKYIRPSEIWASERGFSLPLSFLVILDSYIHSGTVPYFLRKRFIEPVPSRGGDERQWVKDYVACRKRWMEKHENNLIRNCVYRMDCFITLILDDNWSLDKRPIFAHGIKLV